MPSPARSVTTSRTCSLGTGGRRALAGPGPIARGPRWRSSPTASRAIGRRPLVQTEQVLDVVTELVGDDIRLGEVAWSAKPPGQLVEEPEIQVDLAVLRTVERPGRRLREAARGLN